VPRYEAFHLRYDAGQRPVHGGTAALVQHFESFGGGLPMDTAWRAGGPLLTVGLQDNQQVLAWLRGLPIQETNRPNTWEAWGVIGPAGGFESWMTFWDALSSAPDPERLEALAVAFERGDKGPSYPPIPQRLAAVLGDLHSSEAPYRISLRTPSEVALLPWCCLLGPVAPATATVGPPRRMKLNLNVPLAYDVTMTDSSLTEPARLPTASSALLVDVVARAQAGDVDSAVEIVRTLRSLKPAERKKRIFAPAISVPAAPAPAAPVAPRERELVRVQGNEEPRHRERSLFRALRRWTPLMVLAILLLELAHMIPKAQRSEPVVPPTATDTSVTTTDATDTIGTAGSTDTGPTATVEPQLSCNTWWAYPSTQSQVLARVNQKSTVRLSGAAAKLLSGTWDETVARSLSIQMQINDRGCANLPLDGSLGPRTNTALRQSKCATVQRDLAGALQWLCTWSAPQS
jgi:hypothetical protein